MIGLLVGAGLAAAGGIASAIGAKKQAQAQREANNANLAEAEKTRQFNSAEAQKQRDFEERMSNTAVQRRMADLKAAGINPLMAAGGEAASTPAGEAASGVSAKVSAVSESASVLNALGDTFQSIGNSAVKVAMMKDLLGAKKFGKIMKSIK